MSRIGLNVNYKIMKPRHYNTTQFIPVVLVARTHFSKRYVNRYFLILIQLLLTYVVQTYFWLLPIYSTI